MNDETKRLLDLSRALVASMRKSATEHPVKDHMLTMNSLVLIEDWRMHLLHFEPNIYVFTADRPRYQEVDFNSGYFMGMLLSQLGIPGADISAFENKPFHFARWAWVEEASGNRFLDPEKDLAKQ